LAERYQKTFISVNEFISSWEKEIYELTHLDYFTFLLINHIGYQIQHEYISKRNKSPDLHIEPEEIGTLAFNIGDSLESFLENNCLGDCSLSCPTELNEQFNPDELDLKDSHLHILQIVSGNDISKKEILLTDILNYVVLDTLFDFYNYEIGIDLDDADISLMQFADYISLILEKFIESNGQSFLKTPRESASELFENLIQNTDENWSESAKSTFEDETDEFECWKYGALKIPNLIHEYLSHLNKNEVNSKQVNILLDYFRNYTETYAGIKQIDEITYDDLEEFFIYWLIREITLEKNISAQAVKHAYSNFFKWLELSKDVDLLKPYHKLIARHFSNFEDAISLSRKYFDKNSVVEGILEVNASDTQIFNGVFEVEKLTKHGFVHLRDIYYKKRYLNVQINFPHSSDSFMRKILDACIKPTAYGWRLVHLEYIYPQAAKPYLH
jgi:hypothetical protein